MTPLSLSFTVNLSLSLSLSLSRSLSHPHTIIPFLFSHARNPLSFSFFLSSTTMMTSSAKPSPIVGHSPAFSQLAASLNPIISTLLTSFSLIQSATHDHEISV